MIGKNGPEGRNDVVDHHGDQANKPTALETWSQKRRESAEKNYETGKYQLHISTSKNLADLTRSVFDKSQITKDRAQLQADFDTGKIDQDTFDRKSAKIDRREAMMIKSGGSLSPRVAAEFRGVDFQSAQSDERVAKSEAPNKHKQEDVSHSLDDVRGDLADIHSMPIHALGLEGNHLDKGGGENAANDSMNHAHNRVLEAANSNTSGGIDRSPVSQPQNMKAPEMPRIPVQSVYSESAQKVAAEQRAQKKAPTSSTQFASN